MGKKVVLLLILGFMLTGCATTSPNLQEFETLDIASDTDGQIISLADVDFQIVPEEEYYILMEEKLDETGTKLLRRFVKYDGIENSISETMSEVPLPHTFQRVVDARQRIQEDDSQQLALYPWTYLNDSVLAQWEQEEYDFSVEAKTLVSLETLQRMGAVSRVSDPLLLDHDVDELMSEIERIETEYLPSHTSVEVSRDAEMLSQAFRYETNIRLRNDQKQTISLITIKTSYRVDELGHPIELTLHASFESNEQNMDVRLLPVMNDLATFSWMLRDTFVEELGLYGVNEHNPILSYANVSLHYEQEETDSLRYVEKFSIQ